MKKLTTLVLGAVICSLTACSDSTERTERTTTEHTATAPNDEQLAPAQGTVSDTNGPTRIPGEDTGAIHRNTSTPGQLK